MIKACDIEKGMVASFNGVPHIVEQVQLQSPSARGAATLYKVRFRNVQTKQKVDKTYRGDDAVDTTDLERHPAQYLYVSGDMHTFMDLTDYSQFELSADEIEAEVPYLVEDMEGITALVSNERVIGIELPPTVEMELVECEPSIRGATAQARSKPAVTNTGLTVHVPEHIGPGERIRVDTREGTYISRA